MLRMNIDQAASQLLHYGKRNRRIVYKSTGLSRCKQFTAKNTNLRIILQVIREKKLFQPIAGNVENGFYHAFFRTVLNALPVRALSQDQRKSSQYTLEYPAPVSPVITEKPLSNLMSKLSIRTKFRMNKDFSIAIPDYFFSDSIRVVSAGYRLDNIL